MMRALVVLLLIAAPSVAVAAEVAIRHDAVGCVVAEQFSSSAGPSPHTSVSQMNGIC